MVYPPWSAPWFAPLGVLLSLGQNTVPCVPLPVKALG